MTNISEHKERLNWMSLLTMTNLPANAVHNTQQLIDHGYEPQKIYPMSTERYADLFHPLITHHYSVSDNARFVFVIGEYPSTHCSQLYVWDLHRGSARRFKPIGLRVRQMRHFYQIENNRAILIGRNDHSYDVYSALIDYSKCTIALHKILFHQDSSNEHFWSSARANSGIIFFWREYDTRDFILAHIELGKPVHAITLHSRTLALRCCGQPWVYNGEMYLFEKKPFSNQSACKYLTGRLFKVNLKTGDICMVQTYVQDTTDTDASHSNERVSNCTYQDDTIVASSSQSSQRRFNFALHPKQPELLVRRVKQVERNGRVWIITENVMVDGQSGYPDHFEPCRVYILDMQTLFWRKVNWDPQCSYNEMTLDVSSEGTAILLRKRVSRMACTARIQSFLLLSAQPKTLVQCCFHTLITSYPYLRKLTVKQMRRIGLPRYLLAC